MHETTSTRSPSAAAGGCAPSGPCRRARAPAALTAVLLLGGLALAGPAAAEGGGGGNGCPWMQDVRLEVGGKVLTVDQTFFTGSGTPLIRDGYHIYPQVNQLKVRIIGPHGGEWEIGLTRLTGGKRCNAFYAGKAVQITDDSESADKALILTR